MAQRVKPKIEFQILHQRLGSFALLLPTEGCHRAKNVKKRKGGHKMRIPGMGEA
jgi:hypothetical protein